MTYDIAVIGGGPAGYNAAEYAAGKGKKVILFEKGNHLGGVCLNEGCIPTKAMLHSAHLLETISNADKYGITIDGNVSADYGKIMTRKKKIVRKLVAGVKQKLLKAGVEMVDGLAALDGETDDGKIRIRCNDTEYTATDVLLATGSEVSIPPIDGIGETEYWTSTEALSAPELPGSILIIGGGVIGMEFAGFYSAMGVDVTVVEMIPKILGPMDSEVSSLLQQEYEKAGVKFFLQAKVVSLHTGAVTIETYEGQREVLEAERILLSTGRRPITEGLGLETLGIEMNRRAIKVDSHMRTSHKHVYAAGDCVGGIMLAHVGYYEGEVAIRNIVDGAEEEAIYDSIPSVIYTSPEFASVGASEDELQKAGTDYKALKIPMTYAGRFIVENERATGLFKILYHTETKKVLGVQIYGDPASEIIALGGLAITEGMTLDELRHQIFPHPTVAEIFHEAAYMAED